MVETSKLVRENLDNLGASSLAAQIARKHRVALSSMLGRHRSQTVARARRELMGLVRDTFAMSLVEVATVFGRDHTTVLQQLRVRQCELAAEHGSVVCCCRNKRCPRYGAAS